MYYIYCTSFLVEFKWPLTILIIFFCLFKQIVSIFSAIPNMLKNAENIEFSNILKMTMKPLGQENFVDDSLSAESNAFKHLQAFDSPIAISSQKEIEKQILDEKLSAKQAITTLTYQLAHQNINVYLLYTDRYMMLHQIALLEHINKQHSGIKDDEIRNFCSTLHGHDEHNHDLCLKYLLTRKLISKAHESYFITLHGKEYLSFRVKIPPFPGR